MLSFGLRLSNKILSLTGLTISNVPEKTTIESKEEREKEKGGGGYYVEKKKRSEARLVYFLVNKSQNTVFRDDGFVWEQFI